MLLTDLSFEQWIEHAFSHEVRIGRNAWYFDDDIDWWNPAPAVAVSYLTRLFSEPERALRWFSDEQIAQGLTYLVSTSASGDSGWLYAKDVKLEERRRCVESVGTLFARLFAPRCAPLLSHLSEAPAGTLNCVCYMWWDEFPSLALPDDPHFQTLHRAALRTLEGILQLDSLPCRESALHGLGHWQRAWPKDVTPIIDRFLAAHPDLDARLSAYAHSARCGCVL